MTFPAPLCRLSYRDTEREREKDMSHVSLLNVTAGSAYSNITPHSQTHTTHMHKLKSCGVWWQAATVSTSRCNSISQSLSLTPFLRRLSRTFFFSTSPFPKGFFISLQQWVDDFSHPLYSVPSFLSESHSSSIIMDVKGSQGMTVVAMRLLWICLYVCRETGHFITSPGCVNSCTV